MAITLQKRKKSVTWWEKKTDTWWHLAVRPQEFGSYNLLTMSALFPPKLASEKEVSLVCLAFHLKSFKHLYIRDNHNGAQIGSFVQVWVISFHVTDNSSQGRIPFQYFGHCQESWPDFHHWIWWLLWPSCQGLHWWALLPSLPNFLHIILHVPKAFFTYLVQYTLHFSHCFLNFLWHLQKLWNFSYSLVKHFPNNYSW